MTCKSYQIMLLVAAILVATANCAEFKFTPRRNTPGNDINCNQKDFQGNPLTYCKICGAGNIMALIDSCSVNDQCQGFDLEGSSCGYLKSAAGPGKSIYAEGFGTFCKVGAGPCTGGWNVKARADIEGNDLDCNAKDFKGNRLSYCKVNGDVARVADACNANPDCKAFVMVTGYEGQLKGATGPTRYMESAVTFVKA